MLGEFDAGAQQRLERARARRPSGLGVRERWGHGGFALAFLAAAAALAVLAPAERDLSVGTAAAFVLAYAVTSSIEFEVGTGYSVPAQMVFVPMLLLLPTPLVPALVALAYVLSAAAQAVTRRQALSRVLLAVEDAWFSIAPAAVLVLAGAQTPEWRHWPAYLLALAAQLGADLVLSSARAWAALGLSPRHVLGELAQSHQVDVLLAPVGLLAAFAAAARAPYAALLLLPLAVLFLIFARERRQRIERTLELSRAYRGTALVLHDVLERSDEYTGRHAEDVVALTVAVADGLRVDEETRREAELGALLHDVGKIGVPAAILNKPGPLDEREWATMRAHTVVGERMLERVGGLLGEVGRVVRASHERWDGRGYPDGLRAEQIPLAARIVSACDTYDAMVTHRPYRSAMPRAAALAELRESAGTQLDPEVVDCLVAVVRRGRSPTPLLHP